MKEAKRATRAQKRVAAPSILSYRPEKLRRVKKDLRRLHIVTAELWWLKCVARLAVGPTSDLLCAFSLNALSSKSPDFSPPCLLHLGQASTFESLVVVFHGSQKVNTQTSPTDMSVAICFSCHSLKTVAFVSHDLVWLCVQTFCLCLPSFAAVSAFLSHWSHLSNQDKRGIGNM